MAFLNAILGSLLTASSNKFFFRKKPVQQPKSSDTEKNGFQIEGQGYRDVLSRMREKSAQSVGAPGPAADAHPIFFADAACTDKLAR